MKLLIPAVLATVMISGAALAATDSKLTAAPHQFIDAFNKGDMAGASAAYASDSPTIIDEVAPYMWSGKGALTAWADSLSKDSAARGLKNESVTLGDVKRAEVAGDKAYVVLAATYRFDQNGKSMSEPARMTFALTKTGGGWKIRGWAWAGGKAAPAPAPAAPTAPTAPPAKH